MTVREATLGLARSADERSDEPVFSAVEAMAFLPLGVKKFGGCVSVCTYVLKFFYTVLKYKRKGKEIGE